MAFFKKRPPLSIVTPVPGVLNVVNCSLYPDTDGTVLFPKCEIDGVIIADGVPAYAVHDVSHSAPKPKWPLPGQQLPVTVDLADPSRYKINWDKVLTAPELAEWLAAELRGETIGKPKPFPRRW